VIPLLRKSVYVDRFIATVSGSEMRVSCSLLIAYKAMKGLKKALLLKIIHILKKSLKNKFKFQSKEPRIKTTKLRHDIYIIQDG